MNQMKFQIEINAPKEKVWNTLWEDKTFREWASIIDPGTYMLGELKEGNEIQFISSENGYGVTSLVEKVENNESLILRHSADTKENGKEEREKQWTGTTEEYLLTEENGITTLYVKFEVPEELEEYFKNTYPKALRKFKEMAEKED